jgi:hypothetical protein
MILIVDGGSSTKGALSLIERFGAAMCVIDAGDKIRGLHSDLVILDDIELPDPKPTNLEEDPHNPNSQHAKKKHGKCSKNRYGSPFNIGKKK